MCENLYDNEISRRGFVIRVAHLAAFFSVSNVLGESFLKMAEATDPSAQTPIYAFGDEGMFPTHGTFTIGIIFTQNPDKHRSRLKELRTKLNYWRTFTYDSTDAKKVSYALEALDYFASEPDLRFVAKIVGETSSTEQLHYKNLVTSLPPHKLKAVLALKPNRRVGKGKPVRDFLQREVGRMEEVKLVHARNDDLTQLADFMTGNLVLDSRRQSNDNASKNKVKIQMLEALQQKLKVSSLVDNSLASSTKFRVLRG